MVDINHYGTDNDSFQAVGGTPGLQQLVEDFYDAMDTIPEAARIRSMHPEDLTVSRDKLARFLTGWLNGPKIFRPKEGSIHIMRVLTTTCLSVKPKWKPGYNA